MMMPVRLNELIGNEKVKIYLEHMLAHGHVGQSFLFAGPEGIGKSLFAYALAAQLVCGESQGQMHRAKQGSHPDIHLYRPEGKISMHSMQALRQLNEQVFLPPYEGQWKAFIIHEADRMLTYSANALLKTFEEPPSHTLIILLSHNPQALLSTIRSRCRTVHFQALRSEEIQQYLHTHFQLEDSRALSIAQQAQGSLSRAVRLVEQQGDPNRHLLLEVLAQGKLTTYKSLTALVEQLTERMQAVKKQAEESAKEDIYKHAIEQLSAQQQHSIEKELEGAASLAFLQEAQALLQTVLAWFRDLHLLRVRGSSCYLLNPDYETQLQQALQRGEMHPLEDVQQWIEEAYTALQRSTAPAVCFENLFLKLGVL